MFLPASLEQQKLVGQLQILAEMITLPVSSFKNLNIENLRSITGHNKAVDPTMYD